MEACTHASSSFLTLTYSPEHVPSDGSLVPRDLCLFLKRLRKKHQVRYFAVGEYGDQTFRPHYHAALFGVGVDDLKSVQQSWDKGFVYLGDLTFASAQYVAGYVTKKMTGKDDARLGGRYPEFARMSLRPGIGANAMSQVALALQNKHGWNEISRTGDVPSVLRHGAGRYPLGRYLRRKLRERMNFADLKGGDTGVDVFKKTTELQALYKAHVARKTGKTFAAWQDEVKKQRIQNLQARQKIAGAKKL